VVFLGFKRDFLLVFCLLVKRVRSARVPSVPLGWSEVSFSGPDFVPFHLLDRCERLFFSRITQRSLWDRRSFFDLLYACFGHLLDGISEDSLRCHLISGECYADREYRSGRDGSIRVFLPRLLSAERFLYGKGKFVVIVPFKRDLHKATRAIRNYNIKAETAEAKPVLDLRLSEIITYHGIDDFREKIGYYKHYKKV